LGSSGKNNEGRKRSHPTGMKRPLQGRELEREREIRRDEEVDSLRAKIGEFDFHINEVDIS